MICNYESTIEQRVFWTYDALVLEVGLVQWFFKVHQNDVCELDKAGSLKQ